MSDEKSSVKKPTKFNYICKYPKRDGTECGKRCMNQLCAVHMKGAKAEDILKSLKKMSISKKTPPKPQQHEQSSDDSGEEHLTPVKKVMKKKQEEIPVKKTRKVTFLPDEQPIQKTKKKVTKVEPKPIVEPEPIVESEPDVDDIDEGSSESDQY